MPSDQGSNEVARRAVLAGAAALVAAPGAAAAAAKPVPIIDTHIHVYDTTRPQGAAYPEANPTTMPAISLPDGFSKVAAKHGVVGAIAVEASPWLEDNLWALEVVQANPVMVGLIGDLQPEKPEFAEYLDRYHKSSLYLGIRYANLWGYDLNAQVDNPVFVEGIRKLAAAGLMMETNAGTRLMQSVAKLTDKVPDLRVVIDHIAGSPPSAADQANFDAALRDLKARPKVYAKLSSVIGPRAPSTDVAPHKEWLDKLYDAFGEDRVVYGSDYPNSLRGKTTYDMTATLMRAYMATKSREAQEKFFWRNSAKAYRWVKRLPSQPAA